VPTTRLLGASEIEAATGTAAPFLHPVAGHEALEGISLAAPPDAPPQPDAPPGRVDAAPPDARVVPDAR
jgi:hypothetical protein